MLYELWDIFKGRGASINLFQLSKNVISVLIALRSEFSIVCRITSILCRFVYVMANFRFTYASSYANCK